MRGERVTDASGDVRDAPVQPPPVLDQLPGDVIALHIDRGHRSQRPQQLGCLSDRQTQLGAGGLKLGQERV